MGGDLSVLSHGLRGREAASPTQTSPGARPVAPVPPRASLCTPLPSLQAHSRPWRRGARAAQARGSPGWGLRLAGGDRPGGAPAAACADRCEEHANWRRGSGWGCYYRRASARDEPAEEPQRPAARRGRGAPAVPPSALSTSSGRSAAGRPGKRSRAGRLRGQPWVPSQAVSPGPPAATPRAWARGWGTQAGLPEWDTRTSWARRSQPGKLSAEPSGWWGLGCGNPLASELPG